MTNWEPVIGLEIHVQLKTETKMFCRCRNGFGGEPNSQTCPVCLAFPGALPVPNRRAIEETIKLGLALDCAIAERAVFHRKNYFYPDNSEGVPDQPVRRAALRERAPRRSRRADGETRIGITRAHLEEDAAKNVHVAASGRIHGATATLVDFNRCGTPLVEIVTEPEHPRRRDGEAVPPAAAPDRRRARPLGRGARERLDALRRQRLRAPGGLGRAAHAHRAQEHELVQLRGEGDRARDRTADPDLRGGRRRRAGDAALRPGARGVAADALQGGGAGLPVLPRARPRPGASPPAELVDRLRAEIGELPGARILRIADTLSFYDADVLVTGGLDRLWAAVVDAGADPKEAANVLANQFVATGIDPERSRRRASSRSSWPRAPRSRAPRSTRRSRRSGSAGFSADPYLEQKVVADTAELDPIIERIIEANPGPGRAVPRRQAGPPRLLRRPGDEGDRRRRRPARRERAGSRVARLATEASTSSGRSHVVLLTSDEGGWMPGWLWAVIVIAARHHHRCRSGIGASRPKRSRELQGRFGPEYDRVAADAPSKRQAEAGAESACRAARRVRPASRSTRGPDAYRARWQDVQAKFVDDPDGAVAGRRRADPGRDAPARLPGRRLRDARGRLSVDHPDVVENYRPATGSRSRASAARRGRTSCAARSSTTGPCSTHWLSDLDAGAVEAERIDGGLSRAAVARAHAGAPLRTRGGCATAVCVSAALGRGDGGDDGAFPSGAGSVTRRRRRRRRSRASCPRSQHACECIDVVLRAGDVVPSNEPWTRMAAATPIAKSDPEQPDGAAQRRRVSCSEPMPRSGAESRAPAR